jgi:hypothetical protein
MIKHYEFKFKLLSMLTFYTTFDHLSYLKY